MPPFTSSEGTAKVVKLQYIAWPGSSTNHLLTYNSATIIDEVKRFAIRQNLQILLGNYAYLCDLARARSPGGTGPSRSPLTPARRLLVPAARWRKGGSWR